MADYSIPERIPEVVRPLLVRYLTALDQQLPGLVQAVYIHGSMALGAFYPQQSDIDFVAVISRPCADYDFDTLGRIHSQLADDFPQWPLEGSYLQWYDLGRFAEHVEPGPVFAGNCLRPRAHHDLNAVTWWILKDRGIALLGPPPETLDFQVDWDVLLAEMIDNLNTYWVRFTREPGRIMWLFSDFGIQWAVLGVLRQFYTFQAHDITSKTGAGDYALQHLPARWHPLIEEALHIRRQAGTSLYRSRALRAVQAFRFLRYIIDRCNREFIGYTHIQ